MKFRRRKDLEATEGVESEAGAAAPGADDLEAESLSARAHGPWDAGEVDLPEDDPNRIDLGGLVIAGRPGLEVQMQVDEASGEVVAVLLAGPEGAAELRAFAAPRNGDIWDDVRRSIAAEVAQHGGTATEADGPFGSELHVVVTVQTPDGQVGQQPSRVLGIRGPRWLLRATLFGRPAVQPVEDGDIESALRDIVVVRGNQPMPPGDPIPLTIPADAQRVDLEE